jgi:hypothetical protein
MPGITQVKGHRRKRKRPATKYYSMRLATGIAAHNLAFVLFFFNPPSRGGLAQLVERLLCKQNVNGSNPLTSTIFS